MENLEEFEVHDAVRNTVMLAITSHLWNKYKQGTISAREERIRKMEKNKLKKYADQYYKKQLGRGSKGKATLSNIMKSLKKSGFKTR